jgi:hypothetical protein
MPNDDNPSASRMGFRCDNAHFCNGGKPAEEVLSDGEVGAISAELQMTAVYYQRFRYGKIKGMLQSTCNCKASM